MNYIAYTKDGGQYLFAESALDAVKYAMKSGTTIEFKEGLVQGTSIARYARNHSAGPMNTSQLQIEAGEIFTKSAIPGFWQTILKLNQERKGQSAKLPWLYAAFIEKCRELSGITDSQELVKFITEEWENLPTDLNTPQPDSSSFKRENKRIRDAFFATEEGQEYARKWRMSY